MNDYKVYYGEYSLKHWISLILKKDIVIPEYQRYYAWTEEQIYSLIESLKNNQFIPPITIGHYNGKNIIIDGQQRLTSILLAFLKKFPNKESFQVSDSDISINNTELLDEDNTEEETNLLEWRFSEITKLGDTKESILGKLNTKKEYRDLNNEKLIDFSKNEILEKIFLGFSYVVPNTTNQNDIQKYFSSVFRNMNSRGTSLTKLESRESLYYINSDLKEFFSPNFIKEIKVNNNRVDFVRMLSFLSQYKKNGEQPPLARGFSRGKKSLEDYYEQYIYDVINDNDNSFFKFTDLFQDKKYEPTLENFKDALNNLEIPKEFDSIIDSDIYLFGLTYLSIFEKEDITQIPKEELKAKIQQKIEEIKSDNKHTKSPGSIKHITHRIEESIKIYKEL